MKTIPATKARNIFQEIIDDVHYIREPVIVSKHKKPWVVIGPLSKNTEKAYKKGPRKRTK